MKVTAMQYDVSTNCGEHDYALCIACATIIRDTSPREMAMARTAAFRLRHLLPRDLFVA
jgi:hypothetical protein